MFRNIAILFTSVHSHNLSITTAFFQHTEKQEKNSTRAAKKAHFSPLLSVYQGGARRCWTSQRLSGWKLSG